MRCRLCGYSDTAQILSFGKMPLANDFLSSPYDKEELFDLDLNFCPICSLVQISETIPPERLFSKYSYFSSMSQGMLDHAKELAESLIVDRKLGKNSLVIELASNDGYLLQYFNGIPVLGIDPAKNIAEIANRKGIPTRAEFFSYELSQELPQADVIIALNVLGHVADLSNFVRGIQKVLKEDGVCVIEVPYVRDLVEQCEPDTIYFEHLCYYSVTSLVNLFHWNRLEVTRVERIDIHCGSLRLYVTHPDKGYNRPLNHILDVERGLGMDRLPYYLSFARDTRDKLNQLREYIDGLRGQIISYGAAAKGTQLLNYLRLGPDIIDYVVDNTPAKIGKYVPGVHIPIVSPKDFGNPDHVLLTAWNWADEIKSQHPYYKGEWITPFGLS